MQVKIKKLHPDAIIPQYQTKGSAGFDVHAVIDKEWVSGVPGVQMESKRSIVVGEKKQIVIDTGLSFAVPEGYEMQIRPRSGLAAKHAITITNSPGTLDSDYRGPLKIILHNLGDECFFVNHGDRIAQCVINKVEQADLIEVEEFSAEDMEKDRGGGFGSTGVGTEKMIKYGEQES